MQIVFDGWESKLRTSFARQSMMDTLGAQMVDLAPGRVTLAAPIRENVRQQHGYAHAAMAFALGDSAAGYSALSLMAEADEVLTAEMKINLLAPADGDRMEAVGEVVKMGRRLVVVTATVRVAKGEVWRDIAILQGTMVPMSG
ncbi:PaaI family thioesterase [Anianabacter salinae]|uniref:PaaI family thioesterase n=1 Tax=Anianabacter salinae TaxID=2851023 RepID=UPI00225E32CA|nr:PaaI family thioesterase [Anianabacter salinae]MBV0911725.1 PaaI family thioesterase [Anianabacter salinae]